MSKLLTIGYCIALAYQGVFLPDITTYRHRRNWTSWTLSYVSGDKNIFYQCNLFT